jgi:hypothetical protein
MSILPFGQLVLWTMLLMIAAVGLVEEEDTA